MRGQKGITLIALVVTIIVLLILAGISIAVLTGSNGIITNANKANCANAYYGADEQMKLAYMSVRTEIMAQVVADSTYDATTATNTSALANLVKSDLGSAAFVVDDSVAGIIKITYTDTAIDQYLIDGSLPKYDTTVVGVITLEEQSASYEYDVTQ